jgi:hypothetical protein
MGILFVRGWRSGALFGVVTTTTAAAPAPSS